MDLTMVVNKGGAEEPRCMQACPVGIDIPRFIGLAREGRFAEAAKVIREKVPFAGVLSYICPRFCESRCRRAEVDEPVAINTIKRFVLETKQLTNKEEIITSSNKRIGIIGSGPAGLTAAYYLAKICGHVVTVFEGSPVPGGMMRMGIPEYRLPRKIFDEDLERIINTGIDIKVNTYIESLDDLFNQGFDAIFISIGAWNSYKLDIKGGELPGVIEGMDLLKKINLGEQCEVGDRVAIIGGGNVAIDAARTACRLGAKEVHIFYRRGREEMPAKIDEIEQALEEGVNIIYLASPCEIEQKEDGLLLVRFLRMKLLGVGDRRREIEPIAGSDFSLNFNTVVSAIGEQPGIPSSFDISLKQDGNLMVDPVTLRTTKKGVFAGGDCVSGPATVVEAIAAGKKAAINIDRYLGGEGFIDETFSAAQPELNPWEETILELPRQRMPLMDSMERIKSFNNVELGFTEEMALTESERCLRCDILLPININMSKCIECYICQTHCSFVYQHASNPEKARIIVGPGEKIHFASDCIGGCMLCVNNCLTDAISFR